MKLFVPPIEREGGEGGEFLCINSIYLTLSVANASLPFVLKYVLL